MAQLGISGMACYVTISELGEIATKTAITAFVREIKLPFGPHIGRGVTVTSFSHYVHEIAADSQTAMAIRPNRTRLQRVLGSEWRVVERCHRESTAHWPVLH